MVSTAAAASFSPVSFGSFASTTIVPSMSTVSPMLAATNQPTRFPGKFGFIFGKTNDESSANAMKMPAAIRIPILWLVSSPATTARNLTTCAPSGDAVDVLGR